MEKQTTKQRIVQAALELFSQNGYEAVSVEQIAAAVGIKAPSLYKHYKGKQAIFEAVFQEMERRYDRQLAAMQLHRSDAAADTALFCGITADALVQKVRELVTFSLHDTYTSKFRRLLTIEQFRTPALAALYTKRYVEFMLHYHEQLFRRLIKAKVLRQEDAQIMALQYVSPVCTLLGVCDRQPEREEAVMQLLERHIRQFMSLYGRKE